MFGLTQFPFDTETWPTWLQTGLPQIWIIGLFVGLLAFAYSVSFVAKRLVRKIGRRFYETEQQFIGSSWDLAAPLVQLLVFLFTVTGGSELIGFEFAHDLSGYWPKTLAGLVIVGGAVLLATWVNNSLRSLAKRAHGKNRVDDTLVGFAASIIRYVVLGVAVLMAMTQFGFAPGSLIAIVGAVGLAIALALQDTLKAVAAGFMIAAFRPFRIGDWVQIEDQEGEVTEITPFNTSITQVDHKVVLYSNDRVWGNAIVNFTKLPRRRLDLYFDVDYSTDLDHALDLLVTITNQHSSILLPKETWTGVHELKDWSILLRVRAWVPAREYIQVRADVLKLVKQGFDREDIKIPYPHQITHFANA